MGNWREKLAGFIAPTMASSDQVAHLVATEVEAAVKKAQQALPINLDYDPKNEGYRRMAGGQQGQVRMHDMSPLAQDTMLELAYYLYDTSGLVKRFVRDTKNFVLGEGITLAVEGDTDDGQAKQVLDDFWTDPMNQMDLRLESRVEFLGLLGEQVWPVAVNKHNGRVLMSYADPTNIDVVYLVNDFPEMPAAVKLKGTGGRTGRIMPVARPELDMRRKEYGRMVGECFYFAINKPPNSPRGRSDLIHLFDFLNGFEEGLFDELDRLKNIKAFVWDVTVNGATQTECDEYARNWANPKSNSLRVHNELVKWQAVAPTLNQQDNKSFFDLMKTYISACMNRPDSWLGSGGKAYQNEADLMGEPTFKDLASRQRFVKYAIESVLRFVLDQAIIHRTLPEDKNKPYKPVVNFPEVSVKDLKKTVDGLFTLAQSLTLATNNGWIGTEKAAEIFASVASQVGVDIDAAEEIKKAAGMVDGGQDYDKRESLINDIVARIEKQKGDDTGSGESLEQAVEISDGENTIAKVSLNGAQITSLLKMVQEVAAGKLPRESALNLMVSAFPFSREQAEGILGSAGKGFKLKPEEV